jgi:hypothetical protein
LKTRGCFALLLWHTGPMRKSLCVALLVMTAMSLPKLAAQAPPKGLAAHGQNIVDLLVKQDFAKVFGEFTPAMRDALPEDRLRATWATLVADRPYKGALP